MIRLPIGTARLLRQIKVGSVYVSLERLDEVLGGRCVNLVRMTGDPTFEFQLCGSGFALSYRNRWLLICTQHQLPVQPCSEYGLLVKERGRIVSPSRYRGYDKSASGFSDEYKDICVFDFTETMLPYPHMGKHFAALRNEEIWDGREDVLGLIAFGCAYDDQNYDVAEARHFGAAVRAVTCRIDGETSDKSVLRLSTMDPLDVNPDGMSGGPVFGICRNGLEFRAKFAGIITRAGGSTIYAVHSARVTALLEGLANLPSNASLDWRSRVDLNHRPTA